MNTQRAAGDITSSLLCAAVDRPTSHLGSRVFLFAVRGMKPIAGWVMTSPPALVCDESGCDCCCQICCVLNRAVRLTTAKCVAATHESSGDPQKSKVQYKSVTATQHSMCTVYITYKHTQVNLNTNSSDGIISSCICKSSRFTARQTPDT